ncbi:MAG: hypothetical protein ACRCUM_00045 [Mycoplasmoidaceae bacterium]
MNKKTYKNKRDLKKVYYDYISYIYKYNNNIINNINNNNKIDDNNKLYLISNNIKIHNINDFNNFANINYLIIDKWNNKINDNDNYKELIEMLKVIYIDLKEQAINLIYNFPLRKNNQDIIKLLKEQTNNIFKLEETAQNYTPLIINLKDDDEDEANKLININ